MVDYYFRYLKLSYLSFINGKLNMITFYFEIKFCCRFSIAINANNANFYSVKIKKKLLNLVILKAIYKMLPNKFYLFIKSNPTFVKSPTKV